MDSSDLLKRKKTGFGFFIKSISSALIVCFLAQDLASAAPEIASRFIPAALPQKIELNIPFSMGRVSSYSSTSSPHQLYLIQDAHTNESAQRNIAKLIEYLAYKENIQHVFLEAGSGDDSLSSLRNKNNPRQKQIADNYLRKGWIQGPDYADLLSEKPFKLWGVEDKKLYWKEIALYRSLQKKRADLNACLDSYDRLLKTLKNKLYNPLLKIYDDQREAYLKENLSQTDYLEILFAQAQTWGIDASYLTHLGIFKSIRKKESTIDFKKAQAEAEQAIALLSNEDRNELLPDSRKAKEMDGRETSVAFYLAFEEKLAVIASEAKQSRFNGIAASPSAPRNDELKKYFDYLHESQKLNAEEVLKEQETLEALVYGRLLHNDDEKLLRQISENLKILRRLANLQATSQDFETIQSSPKDFDAVEIAALLNRKILDIQSKYEDVVFLKEDLIRALRQARQFYRIANKRDYAFLKNIERKLFDDRKNKNDLSSIIYHPSSSILVAGGYHTEHLQKLLRKKNIPFVSIAPRILQETNIKKYENLLLGTTSKPGLKIETHSTVGVLPGKELPGIFNQLQSDLGDSGYKLGVRTSGSRLADDNAHPGLTEKENRILTPVFKTADEFFKTYASWRQENPNLKLMVLIRHGESASNLFRLVQTHTAFSPLTLLKGVQQAKAASYYFKQLKIHFDRFISSDLERAFKSIQPIASVFKAKVATDKRLREVIIEPVGGAVLDESKEAFPGYFDRFTSDPENYELPGIYSQRKQNEDLKLFKQEFETGPDHNVMVASHGMTILILLMQIFGIQSKKYMPVFKKLHNSTNLGITILFYDPDASKWQLLAYGDNSYLPTGLRFHTENYWAKLINLINYYATAFYRSLERRIYRRNKLSDYYPTYETYWPHSANELKQIEKEMGEAGLSYNPDGARMANGKTRDNGLRSRVGARLAKAIPMKRMTFPMVNPFIGPSLWLISANLHLLFSTLSLSSVLLLSVMAWQMFIEISFWTYRYSLYRNSSAESQKVFIYFFEALRRIIQAGTLTAAGFSAVHFFGYEDNMSSHSLFHYFFYLIFVIIEGIHISIYKMNSGKDSFAYNLEHKRSFWNPIGGSLGIQLAKMKKKAQSVSNPERGARLAEVLGVMAGLSADNRKPTNTDAGIFDNGNRTRQVSFFMALQQNFNMFFDGIKIWLIQSEYNYTRSVRFSKGQNGREVQIHREENSFLILSSFKDILIQRFRHIDLSGVNTIMALFFEPIRDFIGNRHIEKELHLGNLSVSGERLFTGEPGTVLQRFVNVFFGQVRIFFDNLVFFFTGSQQVQYELDGKTQSANTGLSAHLLRVNRDAGKVSHISKSTIPQLEGQIGSSSAVQQSEAPLAASLIDRRGGRLADEETGDNGLQTAVSGLRSRVGARLAADQLLRDLEAIRDFYEQSNLLAHWQAVNLLSQLGHDPNDTEMIETAQEFVRKHLIQGARLAQMREKVLEAFKNQPMPDGLNIQVLDGFPDEVVLNIYPKEEALRERLRRLEAQSGLRKIEIPQGAIGQFKVSLISVDNEASFFIEEVHPSYAFRHAEEVCKNQFEGWYKDVLDYVIQVSRAAGFSNLYAKPWDLAKLHNPEMGHGNERTLYTRAFSGSFRKKSVTYKNYFKTDNEVAASYISERASYNQVRYRQGGEFDLWHLNVWVWRNFDSKRNKPLIFKKIFEAARTRLNSVLVITPLHRLDSLSKHSGKQVFLKDESQQTGGSFKARGVYYEVYKTVEEFINRYKENQAALPAHLKIVTQSTGNHGIAMIRSVTLVREQLARHYANSPEILRFIQEIEPIVFTLKNLPFVKARDMVLALRDFRNKFGITTGHIYKQYSSYEEALEGRTKYMDRHSSNARYMDHGGRVIMIGHGSAGLEINDQLNEAGIKEDKKVTLIIPVGAGGPIGIAAGLKAVRRNVSVVMVQSDRWDAFVRTLMTGKRQKNPKQNTPTEWVQLKGREIPVIFPDGIAVDGVESDETVAMALNYVDAAVSVNELNAYNESGAILFRDLRKQNPNAKVGGTSALTAEALISHADIPEIADADVIVLFGTEGNVSEYVTDHLSRRAGQIFRTSGEGARLGLFKAPEFWVSMVVLLLSLTTTAFMVNILDHDGVKFPGTPSTPILLRVDALQSVFESYLKLPPSNHLNIGYHNMDFMGRLAYFMSPPLFVLYYYLLAKNKIFPRSPGKALLLGAIMGAGLSYVLEITYWLLFYGEFVVTNYWGRQYMNLQDLVWFAAIPFLLLNFLLTPVTKSMNGIIKKNGNGKTSGARMSVADAVEKLPWRVSDWFYMNPNSFAFGLIAVFYGGLFASIATAIFGSVWMAGQVIAFSLSFLVVFVYWTVISPPWYAKLRNRVLAIAFQYGSDKTALKASRDLRRLLMIRADEHFVPGDYYKKAQKMRLRRFGLRIPYKSFRAIYPNLIYKSKLMRRFLKSYESEKLPNFEKSKKFKNHQRYVGNWVQSIIEVANRQDDPEILGRTKMFFQRILANREHGPIQIEEFYEVLQDFTSTLDFNIEEARAYRMARQLIEEIKGFPQTQPANKLRNVLRKFLHRDRRSALRDYRSVYYNLESLDAAVDVRLKKEVFQLKKKVEFLFKQQVLGARMAESTDLDQRLLGITHFVGEIVNEGGQIDPANFSFKVRWPKFQRSMGILGNRDSDNTVEASYEMALDSYKELLEMHYQYLKYLYGHYKKNYRRQQNDAVQLEYDLHAVLMGFKSWIQDWSVQLEPKQQAELYLELARKEGAALYHYLGYQEMKNPQPTIKRSISLFNERESRETSMFRAWSKLHSAGSLEEKVASIKSVIESLEEFEQKILPKANFLDVQVQAAIEHDDGPMTRIKEYLNLAVEALENSKTEHSDKEGARLSVTEKIKNFVEKYLRPRRWIMKQMQPLVDVLSVTRETENFPATPNIYLLLGHYDLRVFKEFAEQYISINQYRKPWEYSPIVIQGSYGRATDDLRFNIRAIFLKDRQIGENAKSDILRMLDSDANEAELIEHILNSLGIRSEVLDAEGNPKKIIYVDSEKEAKTTVQNLQSSVPVIKQVIEDRQFESANIQIVTTPSHNLRVYLTALEQFKVFLNQSTNPWRLKIQPAYDPNLLNYTDNELLTYLGFALGYPAWYSRLHFNKNLNRESEIEKITRDAESSPPIMAEPDWRTLHWTVKQLKSLRKDFGLFLQATGSPIYMIRRWYFSKKAQVFYSNPDGRRVYRFAESVVSEELVHRVMRRIIAATPLFDKNFKLWGDKKWTQQMLHDWEPHWQRIWYQEAMREKDLKLRDNLLFLATGYYVPEKIISNDSLSVPEFKESEDIQEINQELREKYIPSRMLDYKVFPNPPTIKRKEIPFGYGDIPAYVITPNSKDFPGPRPVFILYHGITSRKEHPYFDRLEMFLVSHGITVIRPDLPLHGEYRHGQYGTEFTNLYTRAIKNFVKSEENKQSMDASKIGLFGFSFGGNTALWSLKDPELADLRVFVLNPPIENTMQAQLDSPVYRRHLEYFFKETDDKHLERKVKQFILNLDEIQDYSRVTAFFGSEDKIIDKEDARVFKQKLERGGGKYKIFNQDHYLTDDAYEMMMWMTLIGFSRDLNTPELVDRVRIPEKVRDEIQQWEGEYYPIAAARLAQDSWGNRIRSAFGLDLESGLSLLKVDLLLIASHIHTSQVTFKDQHDLGFEKETLHAFAQKIQEFAFRIKEINKSDRHIDISQSNFIKDYEAFLNQSTQPIGRKTTSNFGIMLQLMDFKDTVLLRLNNHLVFHDWSPEKFVKMLGIHRHDALALAMILYFADILEMYYLNHEDWQKKSQEDAQLQEFSDALDRVVQEFNVTKVLNPSKDLQFVLRRLKETDQDLHSRAENKPMPPTYEALWKLLNERYGLSQGARLADSRVLSIEQVVTPKEWASLDVSFLNEEPAKSLYLDEIKKALANRAPPFREFVIRQLRDIAITTLPLVFFQGIESIFLLAAEITFGILPSFASLGLAKYFRDIRLSNAISDFESYPDHLGAQQELVIQLWRHWQEAGMSELVGSTLEAIARKNPSIKNALNLTYPIVRHDELNGARLANEYSEINQTIERAFTKNDARARDNLIQRFGPETRGFLRKVHPNSKLHLFIDHSGKRPKKITIQLPHHRNNRVRIKFVSWKKVFWMQIFDPNTYELILQAYYDQSQQKFIYGREHFMQKVRNPQETPDLIASQPIQRQENNEAHNYYAFSFDHHAYNLPRGESNRYEGITQEEDLATIYARVKFKKGKAHVYGFIDPEEEDTRHAFAQWYWDGNFHVIDFSPPGSALWLSRVVQGKILSRKLYYYKAKLDSTGSANLRQPLSLRLGDLFKGGSHEMPTEAVLVNSIAEPSRVDTYFPSEKTSDRRGLFQPGGQQFIASKFYNPYTENFDKSWVEATRRHNRFLASSEESLNNPNPILMRLVTGMRQEGHPTHLLDDPSGSKVLIQSKRHEGSLILVRFTTFRYAGVNRRGIEVVLLDENLNPLFVIKRGFFDKALNRMRWVIRQKDEPISTKKYFQIKSEIINAGYYNFYAEEMARQFSEKLEKFKENFERLGQRSFKNSNKIFILAETFLDEIDSVKTKCLQYGLESDKLDDVHDQFFELIKSYYNEYFYKTSYSTDDGDSLGARLAFTGDREKKVVLKTFNRVQKAFGLKRFTMNGYLSKFHEKDVATVGGHFRKLIALGLLTLVGRRGVFRENTFQLLPLDPRQLEAVRFVLEEYNNKTDQKYVSEKISQILSGQYHFKAPENLWDYEDLANGYKLTNPGIAQPNLLITYRLLTQYFAGRWFKSYELLKYVKGISRGAFNDHLMLLQNLGLIHYERNSWTKLIPLSKEMIHEIDSLLVEYSADQDFGRLFYRVGRVISGASSRPADPVERKTALKLNIYSLFPKNAPLVQGRIQLTLPLVIQAIEAASQKRKKPRLKDVADEISDYHRHLNSFERANGVDLRKLGVWGLAIPEERDQFEAEVFSAVSRLREGDESYRDRPLSIYDLADELRLMTPHEVYRKANRLLGRRYLSHLGVFLVTDQSPDRKKFTANYLQSIGIEPNKANVDYLVRSRRQKVFNIRASSKVIHRLAEIQEKWRADQENRREKERFEYIKKLIEETVSSLKRARLRLDLKEERRLVFRLRVLAPGHAAVERTLREQRRLEAYRRREARKEYARTQRQKIAALNLSKQRLEEIKADLEKIKKLVELGIGIRSATEPYSDQSVLFASSLNKASKHNFRTYQSKKKVLADDLRAQSISLIGRARKRLRQLKNFPKTISRLNESNQRAEAEAITDLKMAGSALTVIYGERKKYYESADLTKEKASEIKILHQKVKALLKKVGLNLSKQKNLLEVLRKIVRNLPDSISTIEHLSGRMKFLDLTPAETHEYLAKSHILEEEARLLGPVLNEIRELRRRVQKALDPEVKKTLEARLKELEEIYKNNRRIFDERREDIRQGIQSDSGARLASDVSLGLYSEKIYGAFERYFGRFRQITNRAQERFESRDWAGLQEDFEQRIHLFTKTLDEFEDITNSSLLDRRTKPSAWNELFGYYHALIKNQRYPDLAVAFFNSVMRRAVKSQSIPVEYSFSGYSHPRQTQKISKIYRNEKALRDVLAEIFKGLPFNPSHMRNIELDIQNILDGLQHDLPADTHIESVEVLKPLFYRNKGAYLVGRIHSGGKVIPFIVPFLNEVNGIYADAVLTDTEDVNNIFSTVRSNFHVDVENYETLVEFMQSLLPRRSKADFYSAIGFEIPAKINIIEQIQHKISLKKKFHMTEGLMGNVMIVFTLDNFEYVLKVISDFSYQHTSPESVMRKYEMVHQIDRVGRLLDAMHFQNLELKISDFDPQVLQQLKKRAPSSILVSEADDRIVIKDVYIQRKVTPLNVYLKNPLIPEEQKLSVLKDLAKCIRDMAEAGINQGDYAARNFGVTHYGRVVSYDYDGLEPLSHFNIRRITEKPSRVFSPDEPDEDMFEPAEENVVGDEIIDPYDMLPEQENSFMSVLLGSLNYCGAQYGSYFRQIGQDLFTVEYWKSAQQRSNAHALPDFFPYRDEKRFINEAAARLATQDRNFIPQEVFTAGQPKERLSFDYEQLEKVLEPLHSIIDGRSPPPFARVFKKASMIVLETLGLDNLHISPLASILFSFFSNIFSIFYSRFNRELVARHFLDVRFKNYYISLRLSPNMHNVLQIYRMLGKYQKDPDEEVRREANEALKYLNLQTGAYRLGARISKTGARLGQFGVEQAPRVPTNAHSAQLGFSSLGVRDYALGARMAEPEAAEKWAKLEDFLSRHRTVIGQLPSGAIYAPTPLQALGAIFKEYEKRFGGERSLKGKHYFSLGSGGLYDSLVAAFIYNMQVTAVELDPLLSRDSQKIILDAEEEGLIQKGQIQFHGQQNAFDLEDWGNPDVVFFFYSVPNSMKQAEGGRVQGFEEPFFRKIQSMRPGSLVGILFTASQKIAEFDQFELIGKPDDSIQVSQAMGGLYLDLYSLGVPIVTGKNELAHYVSEQIFQHSDTSLEHGVDRANVNLTKKKERFGIAIGLLSDETRQRISTGNILLIGPGNNTFEIDMILEAFPQAQLSVVDVSYPNLKTIKKILDSSEGRDYSRVRLYHENYADFSQWHKQYFNRRPFDLIFSDFVLNRDFIALDGERLPRHSLKLYFSDVKTSLRELAGSEGVLILANDFLLARSLAQQERYLYEIAELPGEHMNHSVYVLSKSEANFMDYRGAGARLADGDISGSRLSHGNASDPLPIEHLRKGTPILRLFEGESLQELLARLIPKNVAQAPYQTSMIKRYPGQNEYWEILVTRGMNELAFIVGLSDKRPEKNTLYVNLLYISDSPAFGFNKPEMLIEFYMELVKFATLAGYDFIEADISIHPEDLAFIKGDIRPLKFIYELAGFKVVGESMGRLHIRKQLRPAAARLGEANLLQGLTLPFSHTMIYPASGHNIYAVRDALTKFPELKIRTALLVDQSFFYRLNEFNTPENLVEAFGSAGFMLDDESRIHLKEGFSNGNRIEINATINFDPRKGESIKFVLYRADYMDAKFSMNESEGGFALTLIETFGFGGQGTHPDVWGQEIYKRVFRETAVNGFVLLCEAFMPPPNILAEANIQLIGDSSRPFLSTWVPKNTPVLYQKSAARLTLSEEARLKAASILKHESELKQFLNIEKILSVHCEVAQKEDESGGDVLRFVLETEKGKKVFYAKLRHTADKEGVEAQARSKESWMGKIDILKTDPDGDWVSYRINDNPHIFTLWRSNPTTMEYKITQDASKAGITPPSTVVDDTLLVQGVEDGISLDQLQQDPQWLEFFIQNREYFLKKIGQTYSRLNQLGIFHVDTKSKHVFLTKKGEVFLIDFSARGGEGINSARSGQYIPEIDLRNIRTDIAVWADPTSRLFNTVLNQHLYTSSISMREEFDQWLQQGYKNNTNVTFVPWTAARLADRKTGDSSLQTTVSSLRPRVGLRLADGKYDLSSFFTGVAIAHAAELNQGLQLPLKLNKTYIFKVSVKDSQLVAEAEGVEPIRIDLKARKTDAKDDSDKKLGLQDIRLLVNQLNSKVQSDLEGAEVSHEKPVVVQIDTNILNNESYPVYVEDLLRVIAKIKALTAGQNAYFQIVGDKTIVDLAAKSDTANILSPKLPDNLGDHETVYVGAAAARLGVRNIYVQKIQEGELPAFFSILLLAIYAGRISLSLIPEKFRNAYNTLAAAIVPSETLPSILKGLVREFALRPIAKFDLNKLFQYFRLLKKTEQFA